MDKLYGNDWPMHRRLAIERDGFTCRFCNSTTSLMVHHIRPVRRRGTHAIWNLITLCRDCHLACHSEIRRHGLCTVPDQDYDEHWTDLTEHIDVLTYAIYLDSIGLDGDIIRQKELAR